MGQAGTGLRDAIELLQHEADRPAGDEHRRRVHHILGRRPQVHPTRGLLPDTLDESTHQRLDGSADPLPLQQQLIPVVAVGRAGRGDRGSRGLGDRPREGAGASEGGFGSQHRLEPRATRHRLPQLGRDEEGCERGHTAKNVVCPGPCSRMSKRKPPSSATATSVARAVSSRRESTGSAAFASASSGK